MSNTTKYRTSELRQELIELYQRTIDLEDPNRQYIGFLADKSIELVRKNDKRLPMTQEYLSTDSLDGFVDLIQNNLTLTLDEVSQLITADRKRVAIEARIDPFEFVEPCEPDCDEVRHAYHQGQWDMATRIEAQQEEV